MNFKFTNIALIKARGVIFARTSPQRSTLHGQEAVAALISVCST